MSEVGEALIEKVRALGSGRPGDSISEEIGERLERMNRFVEQLDDQMVQRRKDLNDCDRYFQFCEQVRIYPKGVNFHNTNK